jgi:hypothetical protein
VQTYKIKMRFFAGTVKDSNGQTKFPTRDGAAVDS